MKITVQFYNTRNKFLTKQQAIHFKAYFCVFLFLNSYIDKEILTFIFKHKVSLFLYSGKRMGKT